MRHVVIGTAGHVDHGKSSLVLALTGTDPDRLQEEKARGITIDLGFAHTVEDGIALSFVDVPGHERFVRNMLAGVGGIDLVMLHVAADESVMPQTREHFDICRLLRVPAGLVVITKADLADEATLDVVRLEVQELVAGSFLDGAPVVAVSARTGAGLPEIRRTLAGLAGAAHVRPCDGPPRLPIDRVFSSKGFGTIVTGTLVSGRLRVDGDLELQPSGRAVKVRGLHVHGTPRIEAEAAERVAANLAGVEVAEIARGETLMSPGAAAVTRHVDAWVELVASATPLRHGARVHFHQGTRALPGRIALSAGADIQPGASGFARLHLEGPVAVTRGDRFILRAYSPLATIGGGIVLDPVPSRRGVRTAAARARFARLAFNTGDPHDAVRLMVEETGLAGVDAALLGARVGRRRRDESLTALQGGGDIVTIGDLVVSAAAMAAAGRAVLAAVADHHARRPAEEGMPREELRERLFRGAPLAVFEHVIAGLVARGGVVARERVALAGYRPVFSDHEQRVREAMLRIVGDAALLPPDRTALASMIGVTPDAIERLGALLVRQKALARVGDFLFAPAALDRLKIEIRALKGDGPSATLDVAAFKERYGMTRKHAIPLLEFLDRERVTRRVGETRHIL